MDKLKEFQKRFRGMTDKGLITALKAESSNNGWTSSRADFSGALHAELRKRHIVLCPKCHKQKIRTPFTNHFEKGKLWHSPWFSFMIPCQDCQKLSAT